MTYYVTGVPDALPDLDGDLGWMDGWKRSSAYTR